MHPALQSFIGGVLIGLAAWLLLASLGRIAGISGVLAGSLTRPSWESAWRYAFLTGLVFGGALFLSWLQPAQSAPQFNLTTLIGAGLLVGIGTVLGSGCTSGHGVCGLGRRSLRSLVATLTFMAVAMLTVYVTR
jgi:uncharacterized protein